MQDHRRRVIIVMHYTEINSIMYAEKTLYCKYRYHGVVWSGVGLWTVIEA